MPATVSSGFSSSFQTRISDGTIRLSRTEGSSKCGVTMAMSPSRGRMAAVRRSLRHHCTPVKYTSDAPGSTSKRADAVLGHELARLVDTREVLVVADGLDVAGHRLDFAGGGRGQQ